MVLVTSKATRQVYPSQMNRVSPDLSGSHTQQGDRDHRAARNRALAELRDSLQAFIDDFQESKRNPRDTELCRSGSLALFCLCSRFQYDPNVLQPFFTQLDQLERIQHEAEQRGFTK